MAIDPIAEQLRKDTVQVCNNIFSYAPAIYDEWPEGDGKGNVFDMGSFKGSPDGKYPDNYGKWMDKWIETKENIKNNKKEHPAWCKYFITRVVMPRVKQINSKGKGRENARGGKAVISEADKDQKTYDFPVPGMVWFREKNPKVGKSKKGDNAGSGHVGIVIRVDYKNGQVWTCEGNAGSKVIIKKTPYEANFLNNYSCCYYPIWTETEESLREAADKDAGFKGAADTFANKVNSTPPSPGGNGTATSNGYNSTYPSSTSDPGTSSSEKQPFEIPYMTVAEATDYLKNLSNPNQGNGNGTTTGQLGIDALPQTQS